VLLADQNRDRWDRALINERLAGAAGAGVAWMARRPRIGVPGGANQQHGADAVGIAHGPPGPAWIVSFYMPGHHPSRRAVNFGISPGSPAQLRVGPGRRRPPGIVVASDAREMDHSYT
jgi:hypothetical protein